MERRDMRDHPAGRSESAQHGSSVATHRKGERVRTYVHQQRPEARM